MAGALRQSCVANAARRYVQRYPLHPRAKRRRRTALVLSTADALIRDTIEEGVHVDEHPQEDKAGPRPVDDNLTKAPEWVKIVAIAVASSIVAIIEYAVKRRAPLFWTPIFFLVSFILWRLSLRDVSNSNVPARSPDRLFLVAVTLLVMLWEYTLQKTVRVAPWLCLACAVLLSPSRRDMDNREGYLAAETLARAEREYMNRLPVTPRESAAWFGRLLSCFWGPYVEPMLLKNAILPLQEQVEAAAPKGWTLTLDTFSLGDVAPSLTGWQVYNDVATGTVARLTADFSLDSASLNMGITGSGPFVGTFFVTLKGISVQGTLQFVPFARERLMLFSFVEKPRVDIKLHVRGRFIGQQSIPQFAFLRGAILAAVQKDFVEPNRSILPLEYAPVLGEPLASRVRVRVLTVRGISEADNTRADALGSTLANLNGSDEHEGIAIEVGSTAEDERTLRERVVSRVLEAVPARRAAGVRVAVAIPEMQLERQTRLCRIDAGGAAHVDAPFEMQMSLPLVTLEIKVLNERGFSLGSTRMRAAHLPDGSTAFWGTAPDGQAIAARWTRGGAPWRASLVLDGAENATVDVECAMDAWQYSLDTAAPRQFRKGLRSVVAVQVLEGRGLVASDFNGLSDPYVLVTYNKRATATRTAMRTLNPVWGDVLLFQENRSMLARRLRLDVFDRDRSKGDDALGWGHVNLDLVAEGQVHEQWVQLRNIAAGELRVRLLVLSGTDDSREVREEVMRALDATGVGFSSDVLEATVERIEGAPQGVRRKPAVVSLELNGCELCTNKAMVASEGTAEWSETLRFRIDSAQPPALKVWLRDASGGGLGLSGRELGRATVSPSAVLVELRALRAAQQLAKDGGNANGSEPPPPQRRRISPARLLTGDLGRDWAKRPEKRLSAKARQVRVGKRPGDGVAAARTDEAEVWVPLVGAGSGARLQLRLQGVLGESEVVKLNPFQEAAVIHEGDNEPSGPGGLFDAALAGLRGVGKRLASLLFD